MPSHDKNEQQPFHVTLKRDLLDYWTKSRPGRGVHAYTIKRAAARHFVTSLGKSDFVERNSRLPDPRPTRGR